MTAALLSDRRLIVVAWLVACVATLGSLNYSLGMGLFPCRLCWYQRILMYPLVVVLGVAIVSDGVEPPVWWFVLPLSLPGLAISAYHSWLQVTPSATCSFVGCATVKFRLFGLLTIPNQSLLAFAIVSAAMVGLVVESGRRRSPNESESA